MSKEGICDDASIAMLITPRSNTHLITHRLSAMMILAAVFAPLSGVIGLYLSFNSSSASGAAIVLTSTLFFMLAFGWKKFRRT